MIVLHHTGNPTDDDLSAEEINASHQAQGCWGRNSKTCANPARLP